MIRCHFCGKILHEMPYRCQRCGNIFCSDHHLPENHNCSSHHPTNLKCDHCGKQCNLHSFHCSFCGGTYCGDHRLPFSHNCINEDAWRKGTSRPRSDDKPKEENSSPPLTECMFCGVRTPKIFYCYSCGHNYCFIHKSPPNHNCVSCKTHKPQSSNFKRTVRPSKSASNNQIVVAFLVIVAIVLAAVFAFAVYGYPAGPDTTNQPAATTANYVSSNPTASQYTPVSVTETTKSIFSPIAIPTKNFETGFISKSFPYILRSKSGSINVNLYSGVYTEMLSQPSPVWCTRYNSDSSPCTSEETRQYNLKYLDNPIPKKYLDELVTSIKSKTSNNDDQARIAINLVQQIPYDNSRLYSTNFKGRSPYEVLYDNKGICGEKSKLLAYLLRGLGYGVVLFDFSSQNHMAVGIKSPVQYSYKNSGYAFIESTSPTIPTDSQGDYVGAGKLTSTPQIIPISDGSSFSSISEEYRDSIAFNQFDKITTLSPEQYRQWEILAWKYGVVFSDGSKITENPSNKPLCDGGMLCNGECYDECGLHMIGKCTSNGVICEGDPYNCPAGQSSCMGQCWLSCPGLSGRCTPQGLVCYY